MNLHGNLPINLNALFGGYNPNRADSTHNYTVQNRLTESAGREITSQIYSSTEGTVIIRLFK